MGLSSAEVQISQHGDVNCCLALNKRQGGNLKKAVQDLRIQANRFVESMQGSQGAAKEHYI